MRKITPEELRRLRNDVPVELVFDELRLDSRWRGQRREFRCPKCYGMHVAVHDRVNLARCFRCQRNYNPIDLLMLVPGLKFPDAIRHLRRLAITTASRSTKRPDPEPTRRQVAKVNTTW